MARELSAVVCLLCLSSPVMWLSGCGARQTDLANTRIIRLDNHAPGKVDIAWSRVRETKEGFVVAGVLRRKDRVGPPIGATVDAEIVSPSGSVLEKAQSDNLYVPRRKVNRVQGFERFSVRFFRVPPEGSSIRVVVRNS